MFLVSCHVDTDQDRLPVILMHCLCNTFSLILNYCGHKKTSEEFFGDFEQYPHNHGLTKMKGQTADLTLPHGALAGTYTGRDGEGNSIIAEGFCFVKDANGYSLICTCSGDDFPEFQPVVESMAASLAFISHEEASQLRPPCLRIHEVKSGDTWDTLTKAYFGSSEGAEKLAEYNGFAATHNPAPGDLIKVPPSLRI
jgi:hypothetical protein